MNEMWKKLIEQFEENGYTPRDVQRIVHFYEVMMDTAKRLKKLYEDEENDSINRNTLHSSK
ncbi:hypothetical protein [Neobacillus drentensis]|uniref:hypothetical protein n=1 Tax=Neobacillus drentensis TaxID=220684 RepID=UPI002FFDAAE5